MLTIEEELVDIALQGLANQKVKVDKLILDTSTIEDNINKNKSNYKKDRLALDKKINKIDDDMQSSVATAIAAIPIPADGKDGYIGIDGKDGTNGKDGLTGPIGKIGLSGTNGKDGIDGKNGVSGINGINGKSIIGPSGTDGTNGVGIANIKSTHSKLLVELTDGRVKDFKLPKPKEIPAGVSAMPTEVVVLRNLADVKVDNTEDGDVLTKENGKWIGKTPTIGTGDTTVLEARVEIEAMFKVAQTTNFKELSYNEVTGNITNVDIYTTSGKTLKLFSKIIGYNVDNNIDTISIIDEVNSNTIVKTLSYINGNLVNITSTYTI